MRKELVGLVLLGLALLGFFAFRHTARAEAAAGNCYTEVQGPSQPMICN